MQPIWQVLGEVDWPNPQLAEYLRGFDGDTSVLFVFAGVREPRLAGSRVGDDAGFGDQRVRQSGLAVVDVSDDGHVADVPLLVHHHTDLVHREIHLNKPNYHLTSQFRTH